MRRSRVRLSVAPFAKNFCLGSAFCQRGSGLGSAFCHLRSSLGRGHLRPAWPSSGSSPSWSPSFREFCDTCREVALSVPVARMMSALRSIVFLLSTFLCVPPVNASRHAKLAVVSGLSGWAQWSLSSCPPQLAGSPRPATKTTRPHTSRSPNTREAR